MLLLLSIVREYRFGIQVFGGFIGGLFNTLFFTHFDVNYFVLLLYEFWLFPAQCFFIVIDGGL